MKHLLPLTLLVLCLCVLPATAVVLEVTVSGTVSGLSRENSTLTIADPARYGCSYPATGEPVCSYTPMENTTLTGSVPAESAFSVFHTGDRIIATSLGGAGGQWIALAKTTGTDASGTVTDIIGDPSKIPAPLAGDYGLGMSTAPDCTACSGTTCTAKTSLVHVLSSGNQVMVQELEPGHAMTYSGRNDGSGVSVTFVRGQASPSACAGRDHMMTGMQPISLYIVQVVPPIGAVSGQETPAPSATPAEVTVPVENLPTPTRSAMFPLAATGAVALAAVILAIRRM